MYTQFYFLHLDKTTAKTAGIRLFDPLYPIMEQHGVKASSLNKDHKSHNYWQDFNEDTFIFSVVRDPVLRALSEFSWWANYGDDGVRTHSAGRDRDCPFYTQENLLSWLQTKHVKNYQSGIIGNNVSRINMLVKAESIKENENKLRSNILSALGISHEFAYYPPDFENGFMPVENAIATIIEKTPGILDTIREFNKKDIELYNQASTI
jgi:hypothetical protein